MRVLTFDIATSTGVAWGTAGETPLATTHDLGKGLSDAKRFAKVIEIAGDHIETYQPDLVAYEAPVAGKHANHLLIGLVGCVAGVAASYGHDPVKIDIGSYRKHFLGKHYIKRDFPTLKDAAARKAIKQLVIDRCELLGWSPDNDDEADAMALWDYAAAKARGHQSVPAGGLFKC